MKIKSAFLLTSGILIGFCMNPIISYSEGRYDDLRLFTRVFNLIETNYVDEINDKDLIVNSVRGLLGGLDPYSAYLKKEDFKDFRSETLGRFGGLGIEVMLEDGFLKIISPIEDSPAEKAGVKPGDIIISINDEMIKGLDIVEASKKLRGKIGTKIRLSVRRKGVTKLLNFDITRAKITVKSVKHKVLNKKESVHYIRVTSFLEKTAEDFAKYIKQAVKENPKSSFIVDLRGNPGGLLKQAVDMADMFISSGDIVSTIGRDKKKKNILHATKQATLSENLKMILIVDENSASASEIFAGALKDHKKATLIGQTTYGKGSVQSVIPLESGDGVKLTIAKYYSPNGNVIDKKGVIPNVELKKEKKEKDYKLNNIKKDPWVVKAMSLLEGKKKTS